LQVRVADATEAVAPNATIMVRGLETSATRTVNTDATGWARINQLAVGAYEVQVSLSGFMMVTTSPQYGVGTSLSSPSTFGYYSGADTNSRRIALTARSTW
jgi:hypothetical protein